MSILESLTTEKILYDPLPIIGLLDNSFYYPASEFDGGVIKHFGKEFQSFVYCDYATGEEALLKNLDGFRGYRILGHRALNEQELIPNGWEMQLPEKFNTHEYNRHEDSFKKPFAHWAVYEREEDYSDDHGPKRFSLIYIGGEGVATYQALYWSNKKTAKALAIIQSGAGFGLNWTNFRDMDGALAWVVMKNEFGTPDAIFYGGVGIGYDDLNWQGYQLSGTIEPYYDTGPLGKVTIWTKFNVKR